MMGLTPVGAGPRFLCLTGFDFAITVLYTKGGPWEGCNLSHSPDHNPRERDSGHGYL